MGRPRIADAVRLQHAEYTILTSAEHKQLVEIVKKQQSSKSAVLRDAFLRVYGGPGSVK